VGAKAVYIKTSLLSHQRVKEQREPKMAPSLFKRAHEIEKVESDKIPGLTGPWQGLGLVDRYARA
jgi:hypothetical protein